MIIKTFGIFERIISGFHWYSYKSNLITNSFSSFILVKVTFILLQIIYFFTYINRWTISNTFRTFKIVNVNIFYGSREHFNFPSWRWMRVCVCVACRKCLFGIMIKTDLYKYIYISILKLSKQKKNLDFSININMLFSK